MSETYLSIEAAAERLGITPDDMRRVIQLGRLEAMHPDLLGAKPRFKKLRLDDRVVEVPIPPPPYSPTTAYLIPTHEVERLERGLAASRALRGQAQSKASPRGSR